MGTDNVLTAEKAASQMRNYENADDTYRRLFKGQVDPSDFMRWYGHIVTTDKCKEISADLAQKIRDLVKDKVKMQQAFTKLYPDFVSPGAFQTAVIVAANKAKQDAKKAAESTKQKKTPATT